MATDTADTATASEASYSDEIKSLGDKIVGLTLLEAKNLTDYLKDEHGIEPASGGAVMMAPGAGGDGGEAGAAEEKTEFDVLLKEFGGNKIAVIKVVRAATGLGLKEAKDLVESAPKEIKTGVSKEDAEGLQKELEDAGATVELK